MMPRQIQMRQIQMRQVWLGFASIQDRQPVYVKEQAPWSAVRNAAHSYGFAAFTVDSGSDPGGFTTIKITYYDVVGPNGQLAPFETFTLRRPRRD